MNLPLPSPSWYNTSLPAFKHPTNWKNCPTSQIHPLTAIQQPETIQTQNYHAQTVSNPIQTENHHDQTVSNPVQTENHRNPIQTENHHAQTVSNPIQTENHHAQTVSNPIQTENYHTQQNSTDPDISVLNMSFEALIRLKHNSSSRKNFAAKLVRLFFTEEERAKSNVKGKGGKAQLNPVKVGIVKTKAFEMWPLESFEEEKKAWAACIVAIDEANRRLNRNKK